MILFGGNLLLQGKSFETLVSDFTETKVPVNFQRQEDLGEMWSLLPMSLGSVSPTGVCALLFHLLGSSKDRV